MTTTDFLGLALPAPEDYFSLENHWNYNTEKIDQYAAGLTGSSGVVTQMQAAIQSLAGGVRLRGAVNYYADLPANPEEGDGYTVLYAGTTGTTPLGVEFVWTDYNGTTQWTPLGVDPSVFARQTELAAEATAREAGDNTLTAALADLIDTKGDKNLCPTSSGSNTLPTRWLQIPIVLPAGKYVVSAGTLTSDDTDSTLCQATFFTSSNAQASNWGSFERGSGKSVEFTVTAETSYFRLYPSDSYEHSNGDTVTVANFMICAKAYWDISQKFVPYSGS